MVSFTCNECSKSFTAVSKKEAEDAYNRQVKAKQTDAATFQYAVDTGEVAYAMFCPYCGSTSIEEQ
jgi:hypothetical protein